MNAIFGLGKYLFAVPFLGFAYFHFTSPEMLTPIAYESKILVYMTGVALVLASISIVIGKWDKLAAALLGVFLLLTAFLVHLSAAMDGDAGNFLKDLMLAGAAWMYAGHVAKDNSVIG